MPNYSQPLFNSYFFSELFSQLFLSILQLFLISSQLFYLSNFFFSQVPIPAQLDLNNLVTPWKKYFAHFFSIKLSYSLARFEIPYNTLSISHTFFPLTPSYLIYQTILLTYYINFHTSILYFYLIYFIKKNIPQIHNKSKLTTPLNLIFYL